MLRVQRADVCPGLFLVPFQFSPDRTPFLPPFPKTFMTLRRLCAIRAAPRRTLRQSPDAEVCFRTAPPSIGRSRPASEVQAEQRLFVCFQSGGRMEMHGPSVKGEVGYASQPIQNPSVIECSTLIGACYTAHQWEGTMRSVHCWLEANTTRALPSS